MGPGSGARGVVEVVMKAWLWALLGAVAFALPAAAQSNVGGGGNGRTGAASWPINSYLQPDEVTPADAAVDQAGRGEIGGPGQRASPSGGHGTGHRADAIFLPRQPVCR